MTEAPPPEPTRRGQSLHTLLMALVAVALVPVLVLSIWEHYSEREYDGRMALERAAHAAGMIVDSLARQSRMAGVLLDVMAHHPKVLACDPAECARLFSSFALMGEDYSNLYLLGPDGRVLVSARPSAPGVSLAADPAFRLALAGRTFAVGVGESLGSPTLTFAAPVRDKGGTVRLVLAACQPVSSLAQGVEEARLPQGTTLALADNAGRLVCRLPEAPGLIGAALPEEQARHIRQGASDYSGWGLGLDGVERFYVMRRMDISVDSPCYVRVGIPRGAVYADSFANLSRNLAALGVITALALLLTRLLGARHILDPLKHIMEAVRAVGKGEFSARSGLPDAGGELGELARSVDAMAESLERAQAEQEAARAALRQSEERLRAVFNASSDGLLLLVPDGQVLSMNESAARRRNTTPAALEGRNILDIIPEYVREARRERYEEVVRIRQPLRFEEEREGRTYSIRLYPIFDDDGEVRQIASFSRDITDRRLSERAILEAKEAAETANRAKDDFLANMSHELRTPLNGLAGMLRLLREGELPEEQREYLEYATRSARALTDLIDDILDYSALGSDRLRFAFEPFTLSGVLAPLEAALRPLAEEKGLELSFSGPGGVLDETLMGDPGRVGLALRHLLENAVKFTHQGGVRLTASLTARPEGDYATLRIQVVDSGIGIPPDKLAQVFEPFVQAEPPLTKHYKGTGLGLSIVRELAARMGGSVEAKSTPGQGSVFTLCLSFQTPRKK